MDPIKGGEKFTFSSFQLQRHIFNLVIIIQSMLIPDHPNNTLIIEIDNGRFNIQKDKIIFIKENSLVKFVASSTLNSKYTPFLLTDKKVKTSSHRDTDFQVTERVTFTKHAFDHQYRLIPGKIESNGYWVAEERFKYVGPISIQMIFCEVREDEYEVKEFGEQEYFIVEPENIQLDNLIVMSVLPRCIGRFEKWKEFFEKQASLGYNSFHLPPIQELGMSRSYYSIANQHQLSSEIFSMADKYQALERFVRQFNKNGVTFFVDIVLNHTSNTSQWIKDDPDCVFTIDNTPILNSTLLVDCTIFDWGERIKKGELEGFNKKKIETEEDLEFLRGSLVKTLEGLNLWEYFQIREEIVEEMFNLVEPSAPSLNIFIQDPSIQIQKIMSSNIVNLGTGRYLANIVNLEKEWMASGIKYEKNDLVIARNNINSQWKEKVNGWIHNDIPDSIISEMRHRYLVEKSSFEDHLPCVKRAFSLINEGNKTYALNNGWVAGYSSSQEDMIDSKEFYFLRRKVNIWGDLVKLRYGDSKHSSPKLWEHMTVYVETMAKYFNGFRIDNCHNTPIHVGQYFIKKARKVNHSLVVFAELFTNSKEQDSVYIKKMGINALVKEVIHSLDSKSFVASFYNNAGVNSIPLGALGGSFIKNGEKRTFIRPRRPHYLVYELTHDNHTYVQKRIQYKQLPVMVLLSFLGSPVGTNKGFDQYYPEHIPVTQTRQLYQQDKGCQQKIFKNPKIKMVITYEDPVPSPDSIVQVAGAWTNWMPIKMNYNKKYYYLEASVNGGSYEYKFIVDGKWVSETRRPKTDTNGNHEIQLNYQSPRRTLYSNLEGVRSSLSVLRDKFQCFDQVYMKDVEGTVQLMRQDPQTKKRYIFMIANLSNWAEFGKYKLIGSITSATIWVRTDGKIIESSSMKEFFDVESDGNDTVLTSGALPAGFSCVIETELNSKVVSAIERLQEIVEEKIVFDHKLSVFDISTLMFSCSKQEEAIRGCANYFIPGQGQLPYGGLGSFYNILEQSIRNNNLLVPLYTNIIQGDWLFDYTLTRIENKPQFAKLYQKMKETFDLVKTIPRHQIPYFFSQFICNIVNSVRQTLDYGALKINKSSFADNLVLASHQFFNDIPCEKGEYKTLMAAGLPHFTTGWARSWGRDTFISIELLLLHPELCKQNILNFAKNLRHGLIPNLLDQGHNPRYNSRDASWWFIRAVKEYAVETGDYNIFKQTVEMSFLSNDIDIDAEMKSRHEKRVKSIEDIIQEILQSHADGIEFREWRAGIEIDSSMTSDGFNIDLKVDAETGFVIGGNGRNCLTWMDKMGSTGKTKGIPATSRNGCPVELVGLLYHNLLAYDELNKKGFYSYNSVEFHKKTFKYSEWASYIHLHFEEWFWIPADESEKTHLSIEKEYIKRRGIYKDVVKSSNLPEEEYRLRPNALITLALSPSLVKPEHALLYLENVENNLIKQDSLGIGTLDKIHESLYSDEYDNDLDSPEWKKAHGFSYHNGPEWVWLYGFYIQALMNFKQITPEQASALLQDHIAYIRKDIWMSLPQLTNVNGKYNRFSCNAQAWSISSLLLAVKAIHNKQEQ